MALRHALLPALALLLPLAAPAQGLLPLAEAHVSPEGHRYTLIPVPEAGYLALALHWQGAAALARPGREGLFGLSVELPFENAGGRGYDAFSEAMTDASAEVRLANGLTGTTLTLRALDAEGLMIAAGAASDAITDAALDPDDLDWLKSNALDWLVETEGEPGALLDRTLTVLLANGDRRASAITSRPPSVVEAVTVEDVRAWMEASFDDAPLAIVSGPLTAAEAGDAIDAALAGLGPRPAPTAPEPLALRTEAVTAVIDAPDAETALIALAFPASPSDPAVTAALDALVGSPDARLFTGLREAEGATYGVTANYTPLAPDLMIVALIATVPPERAEEALGLMRAAVAALRAEGLTEAELAGARERMAAQEEAFLRDPSSLLEVAIGQSARGRPISPAARRESVEMVDLARIDAALRDALPEGMVGAIVTPRPDLAAGTCAGAVPEELTGC